MGDRHEVYVPVLRKYSSKLQEDTQRASEIKGLVSQSDVGDESWGIVGIFVKHFYTDMLADLQDLLDEMGTGLKAASDKISGCADIYQHTDDDAKTVFDDIMKELGSKPIPTVGPA